MKTVRAGTTKIISPDGSLCDVSFEVNEVGHGNMKEIVLNWEICTIQKVHFKEPFKEYVDGLVWKYVNSTEEK